MRLADFISENLEPILLEWEAFARGTNSGEKMDALALRDHAGEILLATVRDMQSEQNAAERSAKSKPLRGQTDLVDAPPRPHVEQESVAASLREKLFPNKRAVRRALRRHQRRRFAGPVRTGSNRGG